MVATGRLTTKKAPALSAGVLARVALGVSIVLSAVYAVATLIQPSAFDWDIYVEAGRWIVSGGAVYAEGATYAFRYSPLFAYAMVPLAAIGVWGWHALHLASLALLPRRLALLGLAAFPFWFDVSVGNIMAFVFVFAALGLAGRRWAMVAFLALALLAPRPLVLPIALWFLWREPSVRLPFLVLFVVHAIAVLASGWADDWAMRLMASGSEMTAPANLGPTRLLGWAWMPVGIALAVWAFARGKPATAGFLLSPYWFPIYFLLPLADLARSQPATPRHPWRTRRSPPWRGRRR